MRTSFVKNGLVMVVIVLFIGVAVQPSIAINPISSDNEEDCSICPKVIKTHLVRLKEILLRFETLNTNGWFPGNIILCTFLYFLAFIVTFFAMLTNDFSLLIYLFELGREYDCGFS